MSTPTSLELPDRVRRTSIRTARGVFAALEAAPASGVCERDAALLVPGYTGSKEDFLAILDLLAAAGRRTVAIDMRGQFETPGAGDAGGYAAGSLGADLIAVMHATGARHLVGHSYGGLIGREAVCDCELGGYRVPRGTTVFLSQWVTHRDGRFFEDPERFRPRRWADGLAGRPPRYAYFPFGGGPRVCIGNGFALLEAPLLLAAIGQHWRFTLETDPAVKPRPGITLLPENGIPAVLCRREGVNHDAYEGHDGRGS